MFVVVVRQAAFHLQRGGTRRFAEDLSPLSNPGFMMLLSGHLDQLAYETLRRHLDLLEAARLFLFRAAFLRVCVELLLWTLNKHIDRLSFQMSLLILGYFW